MLSCSYTTSLLNKDKTSRNNTYTLQFILPVAANTQGSKSNANIAHNVAVAMAVAMAVGVAMAVAVEDSPSPHKMNQGWS